MIRLGVVADSLGVAPKQALRDAARLGFVAAQIGATSGDLAPANLSRTGRREVMRYVSDLGLRLAALGGSFERGDLIDPAGLDERVAGLARIMELAREIGAPAVTARLGRISDARGREHDVALDVLRHLAERADTIGVTLAVETAGVAPATLSGLVQAVGCPLVRVCYDPAEVTLEGADAMAGVQALGGQIAVAHVRDAIAGRPGRPGAEVPLGQGDVDVREYLAMLDQAGGGLVPLLRRTGSPQPAAELAAGKKLIESLVR